MKLSSVRSKMTRLTTSLVTIAMACSCGIAQAELGDRASWMRGALGLMWHPTSYDWELLEENQDWMSIDPFLEQIEEIDSIDYIQLNLGDAASKSASHTAPSDVIESFMGDVIIVPRAASGYDPFEEWLIACKAKGLRTQVYVNSNCLVYGDATISERWKDYCDTKSAVKTFVKSQSYHTDADYPDRAYMFCYAEYVIKDYSLRYGDLIDAWCFDKASKITANGDVLDPDGVISDQRLFEAWANAARAGNPNAAVAFNHGVGWVAKPFNNTTLVADYTFGHPFGGTGDPTTENLYPKNFSMCEQMGETNGHVYINDGRDWNDKVMGHYYPKMSTSAWNGGNTAALTDAEFLEWNEVGLSGGAITWGLPIVHSDCNKSWKAPDLLAKDWAMEQLRYMNDRISVSKTHYVQFRKRNALNYCLNGGGGGVNGQNVSLWTYIDNHRNLTWEEIYRGDGFYSYKKKGTNYCIDGGNDGANGQNVYLWQEDADNYNQQWKKVAQDDGTYQLRKRNKTNYAIDGNPDGANSQNVDLRKSVKTSQDMHWFIEYK
ncbi:MULTISPECIES: RICIN domain-containing protein [unclassified Lentimonas]|uniref:RICIN domain-containing protein n=1 Tax=unclassified Lentimonas TaxID=2630993 RepID=UPI001389EDC1|nr:MULTISPECIES: RICIN domain-containing protein [unclassified Lentimonas]